MQTRLVNLLFCKYILKYLVLYTIVSAALFSQQRNPDTELMVSTARTLPAEYKADILFYLISSEKIQDSEWQKELLEDIFLSALDARQPVMLADAGLPRDTDSVSSRADAAARLKLDTLSIQSRVIQLMLKDSPAEARVWMERITRREILTIPCSSPTVTNPQIYYETVLEVFQRGFSSQEREEGLDIAFLRNILQGRRSIDELIPFAQMIRKLPVPSEFQLELLNLFMQNLVQLTTEKDTDRQFSFAERHLGLSKEVGQLVQLLMPSQLPAAHSLLGTYQKFLVSHLSGHRCQDTMTVGLDSAQTPRGNEGTSIELFNAMLKATESPLEPLSADKLRPQIIPKGNAELQPLDLSPLNGLLGNLTMKKNGRPPDDPDFDTRSWESRILKVLNDQNETLTNNQKCQKCPFYQRTLIYIMLIDVLDGYLQTQALNAMVTYLAGSRLQQESPIEWLDATRMLLRFTRPLSGKQQDRVTALKKEGKILSMLPIENGHPFLERMQNSGSPVLAAYGQLETLFPQPFDLPY